MKFEDLVAFAKAGYKPADVKELLEMQIESNQPEPEPEPTPEPEPEPTPEPEPEPTPEPEPEPDYKKLYEESQAKLKEAQKANVLKDVSNSDDKKSDDDIVKDLFRSFM